MTCQFGLPSVPRLLVSQSEARMMTITVGRVRSLATISGTCLGLVLAACAGASPGPAQPDPGRCVRGSEVEAGAFDRGSAATPPEVPAATKGDGSEGPGLVPADVRAKALRIVRHDRRLAGQRWLGDDPPGAVAWGRRRSTPIGVVLTWHFEKPTELPRAFGLPADGDEDAPGRTEVRSPLLPVAADDPTFAGAMGVDVFVGLERSSVAFLRPSIDPVDGSVPAC